VHEYSIALDVWQSVAAAAQEHGGGRVRSIKLEIGVLNMIQDEQMTFWITALAERDGSPAVRLDVAHVPARLQCGKCGAETTPEMEESPALFFVPPVLQCAECGSGDVEVIGGRELKVVSAEVEGEEEGDGGEE
jgi:hydrogenase nickel incorporation protein HypA/HybF